jgi:hypothetical protein
VIEETIEETFNEKTGVRRVVTRRRLTAADWRARMALVERLDKFPAYSAPLRTGARPAEGQGGEDMDFLEIVRQAYELACQGSPNFPQAWSSKIPHPPVTWWWPRPA